MVTHAATNHPGSDRQFAHYYALFPLVTGFMSGNTLDSTVSTRQGSGNGFGTMARYLHHAIATVATVLFISGVHAANAPVVPIEEIRPQPEHRRATRLITHVISNYHYRNVSLDDKLSERILERYIEALDPG